MRKGIDSKMVWIKTFNFFTDEIVLSGLITLRDLNGEKLTLRSSRK